MSLLNLSCTTRTRQCNTPTKLAGVMYDGIKHRCAKFNRAIDISREDFVSWLTNNSDFITLHKIYEASGYVTYYRPSIDRIDDDKGYIVSNMQLTDWRGNLYKELHGVDLLTGAKRKRVPKPKVTKVVSASSKSKTVKPEVIKPVIQYTLEGTYVAEHTNPSRAQDATGCHRGNIAKVCNGIGKTVGGYVWKWK
jgi:intein-encoded DNA endonuclease-like protein